MSSLRIFSLRFLAYPLLLAIVFPVNAPATDVSGNVSGTWNVSGSPYVALDHLTVPTGSILMIEAGVEVRFDGPFRLDVQGEMKAVGVEEQPILFTRNRPTEDSKWGGIRLRTSGGRLTIRHCTIEWVDTRNESSSNYYGALYINGDVWPDVRRCTFRYNEAVRGAGLALFSSPVAILEGLLVHDNHATSKGGGIYVLNSHPVLLANCTVVSNRADIADGEGLHIASSFGFSILGCIFWDNGSSPIWDYAEAGHDVLPDLDHSCVEGGAPYPGEGNISDDPLFGDFAGKDFRLDVASPCIDAGHPSRLWRDRDGSRGDMGFSGGRWPAESSPAPHLDFEDQSSTHQISNGGSQSWADYDNDGLEDLLTGGKLYRNLGGTFVDVTGELFPGGSVGDGCWGDYDNDGWLDIFDPGSPTQTLWHNVAGAEFEEVAGTAGIVISDPTFLSDTATWFDYDQDGLLDLYICGSGNFETRTWPDHLFRNNGDGTFADVSDAAGINAYWPWDGHGRALGACDYDEDDDPDLFVGDYWLYPDFHLRNNADGTFTDVGAELGTCGFGVDAGDGRDYYGHTIGCAWSDIDTDGKWDLIVSNLAHPQWLWFSDPVMIYLHEGGEEVAYTEARAYVNIRYEETHSAVVAADWDNDTDVDLFFTSVYEGRRSFLYEQTEPLWFTERTASAHVFFDNGWGAVANDFDADGRLDLVARPGGDPYLGVYRNVTPGTGHFVRFRLEGTVSNRAAIGADLRIHVGDRVLRHQIQSTMGVNTSGHGFIAHVGLGDALLVDRVLIRWPNGLLEEFGPYAVDAMYTLVEGTGDPPAAIEEGELPRVTASGPNPWYESTTIRFHLAEASEIVLELFDLEGRRVSLVAEGRYPAGVHEARLTRDELASGVYLYRFVVGERIEHGRLVLLR